MPKRAPGTARARSPPQIAQRPPWISAVERRIFARHRRHATFPLPRLRSLAGASKTIDGACCTLIEASSDEPQPIDRRDRLVAAVVGAKTYAEFLDWEARSGRSIADAFRELRQISEEEAYEFEFPERVDRRNAFVEALEESGD